MKSIFYSTYFWKISYWLLWAIAIALVLYATHAYFEYRNHELDKRIKNLMVKNAPLRVIAEAHCSTPQATIRK